MLKGQRPKRRLLAAALCRRDLSPTEGMSWERGYKGKRAGGAQVVVSFRECCGNMEGRLTCRGYRESCGQKREG